MKSVNSITELNLPQLSQKTLVPSNLGIVDIKKDSLRKKNLILY